MGVKIPRAGSKNQSCWALEVQNSKRLDVGSSKGWTLELQNSKTPRGCTLNCFDDESGVRMVALFDHEEVGSNSAQGTGSPAMLDALSRITKSFNSSDSKLLEKAIQRSFLVSIQNLF